MKRNMLHLTARMLARTANPRGEGEDQQQDPKFTREEWQAKRKAELADTALDVLIKKTSDLEYDLREARRKVPKEGARVLTPEEAADFDAYLPLGKPADLKTRLDAGEQATADLGARARGDELRTVADAAGMNLKVLTRLAGENLKFEIGEETEKEGKKIRPITVKDGDQAKPLEAYLTGDWADFVPSLMGGKQEAKTGAEFTRQDSSSTSGGGGSWVADKLKAASANTYTDPLQVKPATGVTP